MAQQINTVIVLRNDSTTAWADSSYTLLPGEVGVGYMTRTVKDAENNDVQKQVPIVKIGDGINVWSDLPQAEGVFEKDVILTSAFGKYTIPAAGYVNAGGAGMTTSEWLKSCLSAVKEPKITAPTFSLSATAVGTKEIGSKITTLSWTGTYSGGSYEFGSKSEDGKTTYTKANGTNQSVTGYEVSCTLDGSVEQVEDGKVTLTTPYVVAASATNFASVTSKCSWGASNRVPLNNVGETTSGQLGAGSSSKTVNYSVTAYREGFYFGTSATKVNPSDLTSKDIRALSATGAAYAAGAKTVNVPVGAASIILACPKTNTGVNDILNTTVNAGMNDAFNLANPTVVSVGGADATNESVGDYAADYNVWVYTPAEAYGSTASLTVTLG